MKLVGRLTKQRAALALNVRGVDPHVEIGERPVGRRQGTHALDDQPLQSTRAVGDEQHCDAKAAGGAEPDVQDVAHQRRCKCEERIR